jgi:hypothetical protein
MTTFQSKKTVLFILFVFFMCLLFIWIHFTFIRISHVVNSTHFYIFKIFIHILLAVFLIFSCDKFKTKKEIVIFSFLIPIILSAIVYLIITITVRAPVPNMVFGYIVISLHYPYLAIGGWLCTVEMLIICILHTKYLKL